MLLASTLAAIGGRIAPAQSAVAEGTDYLRLVDWSGSITNSASGFYIIEHEMTVQGDRPIASNADFQQGRPYSTLSFRCFDPPGSTGNGGSGGSIFPLAEDLISTVGDTRIYRRVIRGVGQMAGECRGEGLQLRDLTGEFWANFTSPEELAVGGFQRTWTVGSGFTRSVEMRLAYSEEGGWSHDVTLVGFPSGLDATIACYRSGSAEPYQVVTAPTIGSPDRTAQRVCSSRTPGEHWAVVDGVRSNSVVWGTSRPQIAGLGDSIAAGHGVGVSAWNPDNPADVPPVNSNSYPHVLAAQRGQRAVNYAISGACIGKRGDTVATGWPFDVSPITPIGCSDSSGGRHFNVNDQVRRLVQSGQEPELITVTVGANDIRFADCFRAVLALDGFESSSGTDPCSGATFKSNLKAYRFNLMSLYGFLRATYPNARIVQTRQYLPLPIVSPTPPCRLFFLGYLVTNPSGYAAHLAGGDLDDAVANFADSFGEKQVQVVSELNRVINEVANSFGVLTADVSSFSGHDLCGQYEAYEPFVLAPSGTAVIQVSKGSRQLSRAFALTTKDDYSNGTANPCSDDPCYYVSAKEVGKSRGWTVTVTSAELRVNGAPHPNVQGQAALADAVAAALR